MFDTIRRWYDSYFSSEQVWVLALCLLFSFLIIFCTGQTLAPVFTALVIAYLMQGVVNFLTAYKVPQGMAVFLVYTLFLGGLVAFFGLLLPLVWVQLVKLLNDQVPQVLTQGQILLDKLPSRYTDLVSEAQVADWIDRMHILFSKWAENIVSFSIYSIPNIMGILVFLLLVPVLVFFFLKDRVILVQQFTQFLPKERQMLNRVWQEMNEQIANYVRGKAIEIIIVGIATYIGFSIFHLKYAALLALLVGLSVVIPYIGILVVTIPVLLVSYFQLGWSSEFFSCLLVYGIIQALDGGLLVPWLFSEVVNLHPVLIIIAVLFFGGMWGLWGVFFAIPLATLIKAILNAWPKNSVVEESLHGNS